MLSSPGPENPPTPMGGKLKLPNTWQSLAHDPAQRKLLQDELQAELCPQHPLWRLQPLVIARSIQTDDILVQLGDEYFAIVYLLWRNRNDHIPSDYPANLSWIYSFL